MKKLKIFKKSHLISFLRGGLTIIISTLTVYGIVQAGNLTPPVGAPIAQFYTLSDIYTRLSTNDTATVGDHSFAFTDALAGGGKTLTEIYNAIPTIDPTKLLDDTTYLGITGSIATQTLSNTSATVTAGYYEGTTLNAVDTDLVAGNIATGVNIFGIDGSLASGYTYGDNDASYVLGTATAPGTALKNMYNGSSADYPQSSGGIEDYNSGGARPADSYDSSWTTCNAGNTYCGTSDATYADVKDNSTGLIWSKWLDAGAANTWFYANNCLYPNGLPGSDGVCDASAEIACKCVKLDGINGAKTGCEALTGWRLPYQKELLQAYIDGAWGNLSTVDTAAFWSSTTRSNNTRNAWVSLLIDGTTTSVIKTNATQNRVRCVR